MNLFQKPKPTQNVAKSEFAMSEEAIEAMIRQRELERSVEAKRLANTLIIPTNENKVKERLRQLEHPATFFGENAAYRRERLRKIMADLMAAGKKPNFSPETNKAQEEEKTDEKDRKTSFYTEGDHFLKKIRLSILDHSLKAAKNRIEREENRFDSDAMARKKTQFAQISGLESQYSEVGDSRALSCLALAPSNNLLATGSWSGTAKIWRMQNKEESPKGAEVVSERILKVGSRITDLAFLREKELVSCDVNGQLQIWKTHSETDSTCPEAIIKCHPERLTKIAILPMRGDFAAVGSFDQKWSLWDLERRKCLFSQTGHSAQVYAIAVHPDCSVLLTGDLRGVARLWDLRSGQAVLNLRGHVKQILSADISDDGVHVATGAGDNSIKIWDIRGKNLLHTIAAHFSDVSAVRYQKGDSNFLVSSSFDKTVRVWSSQTFKLLKTLYGHEDRVTDCVLGDDGEIYSSSFDRTWKIWKNESK